MQVTFADCYRELVLGGGTGAKNAYEQWKTRPGYSAVVEFVESFTHERLFGIAPDQVRRVCDETEHALGEVQKERQIREINDFTCPFALQHLFHRFIERTGEIPTWQRFWRWMTHQARPHWLDEIKPLRNQLMARNYSEQRISEAIRWRLGNFYYSALREVDLLVALQARGVKVKYHLLADVLLRVDCWTGRTLVRTYVPNIEYRAAAEGRKIPAVQFFSPNDTPFNIVDFPVEREGFGRVWLVSERSIAKLAERLSAAQ